MQEDKDVSVILPKRSNSCVKRDSMSAVASAQDDAAEESKVDRKHSKDRSNGVSDDDSV